MSKPKKDRFVYQPPAVVYYKPQGVPMFRLEQVILGVDEYEAVRLVDYEGLQQKQAAERMKVSRATCARILESAHRKIAEALTGGKAIRIEGGSFVLARNRYRCRDCNAFWEIPLRGDIDTRQPVTCPQCGSARRTPRSCAWLCIRPRGAAPRLAGKGSQDLRARPAAPFRMPGSRLTNEHILIIISLKISFISEEVGHAFR
jgi:predicted DNA-binding protein (UPF0251 family)